jgi:hypothetical protein
VSAKRRAAFRALDKAAKSIGCTWHMVWVTSSRPVHFRAVLVDPHGQQIASRIAEESELAAGRLVETIAAVQANWPQQRTS